MKDPVIKLLFYYLLLAMLLIGCAALFSSCEVVKGKKTQSADSTAVSKKVALQNNAIESGAVSKSNTVSREEFDWWKTTVFNGLNKDNQQMAGSSAPPQVIIYEGGKGKKEEEKHSSDSAWRNELLKMFYAFSDSMNAKFDRSEKAKHSETKGVGLVTVIVIGLGVLVLSKLLNGVSISFKKQ